MNRHGRNRLLQLALIGLALRAIAPVGYMPASLAEGLPFVLCPGSAGAGLLLQTPGVAHHDHGQGVRDGTAEDARPAVTWKFCAFGVLFAFVGPVAEHVALPALPAADPPPFAPDRITASLLARSWSARAPPDSPLVDDRSSI